MGMVGMETALAIVVEAMKDHDFDWHDIARVMSARPAEISGLTTHGSLDTGAAANIVLIDPAADVTIEPNDHATLGRNNPFKGFKVGTQVVHTFLYGAHVVRNGELAEPHPMSGGGQAWIG